jgi:carnitine-CoA ligase
MSEDDVMVYVVLKDGEKKLEKYKLKQDAQTRRSELWDREREGIEVKR